MMQAQDQITPKMLPGSCSSHKAVTSIHKFRYNSLIAWLNLEDEHQPLTTSEWSPTRLGYLCVLLKTMWKLILRVMITKNQHLVHQKCGETTNCTLTSIQGNLQDCRFLTASCLIMSRSPELESKCIKVLHPHALCCSSTPQNKIHAKTTCSSYLTHAKKRNIKYKTQ